MEYVPVVSSIISPQYLTQFVIHQYGFALSTTCAVLKTGINHSYLITTPKRQYVLRIYYINWKTPLEIREELRILNYLKANHIKVSFPIKDKTENYLQSFNTLEGERYGVLFSFAKGKTIRNPSIEMCYHIGNMMAKMHQLTINQTTKRKDYTADNLVSWAYDCTKERLSEHIDEMQYFKRSIQTIQEKFEYAALNNIRHGIVHLDLWQGNFHIHGEDEITFFDFDNCGNGWLFLDIGYSLMLLFRNEPDPIIYKKKEKSFLKGYESIMPISAEEKDLLPFGGLSIWLYYTGIHTLRFNDFSNPFFSEDFFKFWIQTVQKWMKYHQIEF